MKQYTVAEIAAELGVSKQAVHKKRQQLKRLSTTTTETETVVGNTVYISEEGFQLIKQEFLKNRPSTKTTTETTTRPVDDAKTDNDNDNQKTATVDESVDDRLSNQVKSTDPVLEILREQLAEKDRQIFRLQEQLSREQQLHHETQMQLQRLQAASAADPGEPATTAPVTTQPAAEDPQPSGFISWLKKLFS